MKNSGPTKQLFFCMLLLLFGCSTKLQTLYKIEENGLFGYANSKSKTIIKPTYMSVYTDTLYTIAYVVSRGDIIAIDGNGNHLFSVFPFDNGPDYQSEGLFRIVNEKGEIGFADTLGNIIIEPQYKFASPFKDGKAEVTYKGHRIQYDEHYSWDSNEWSYIPNPLIK